MITGTRSHVGKVRVVQDLKTRHKCKGISVLEIWGPTRVLGGRGV